MRTDEALAEDVGDQPDGRADLEPTPPVEPPTSAMWTVLSDFRQWAQPVAPRLLVVLLVTSSWQSVRALPADARLVLTAAGINQLGAVLEGFLLIYLVHAGFDTAQAALAVAAFALGTLLGAPVGAALTSHAGPRVGMAGALSLTGVLVAVMPVAAMTGAVLLVLVLALLVGISTQAFRPPSSEALSVAVPGDAAVVAFSAFRVAMNAGALIAPLLAAVAIAHDQWAMLFVLDGATSLLAAALVTRLAPRRSERAVELLGESRPGWMRLFTARRLLYLVAMLTSGVVYAQTSSVLPLQLTAAGHQPSLYAAILSIGAITLVGLELPVTTATRGWPVPTAVLVGTLVFGLSFALYGVAPHVTIVVVLACVTCVAGTTVSAPRLWSFPAAASPAVRPAMFAASQAGFGLGMALGPVLGVRAWQLMGQSWWAAVATIGVVSAVTGMWGTRSRSEGRCA